MTTPMVATTVSYREFLLWLALLMGTIYCKREGAVLHVIQMFMIPEKINSQALLEKSL